MTDERPDGAELSDAEFMEASGDVFKGDLVETTEEELAQCVVAGVALVITYLQDWEWNEEDDMLWGLIPPAMQDALRVMKYGPELAGPAITVN